MSRRRPVEVAVIGGGCAAVAAAFELTRPEHRGKYHVSIYQMGWRLGGKGASGRGPAKRIEEHGLHIWMGFYENAFRLMRECYAELKRDPAKCRLADWRDAFFPAPFVSVADRANGRGTWLNWMACFPPGDGLPGDPLTHRNPFTISSYLLRTANLLRTLLLSVQARQSSATAQEDLSADGTAPQDGAGGSCSPAGQTIQAFVASAREIADAAAQLLKYGRLATIGGLIKGAELLQAALVSLSGSSEGAILRLLEAIAASARRQMAALLERDHELRRLWEIIDLVLATLVGIIRHRLINDPRGFDAIDEYDCREWLRLNGACESSLNSAFMRGMYDLAFAYEDGDFSRPRIAAGQTLRSAFRMYFTYRGSMFWKMRAGMGDVVFAPFYEVLRRRGVSFKFFHRLENVRLCDPKTLAPGERPYIEALEFDVQAEVRGGGEYQPLIDVDGLPCWPAAPDWTQLVDGERLAREGREFESHWDRRRERRLTLRVIDDFDFVVLGVGLGAIPFVCGELIERDRRWREMVAHLKTIVTQGFQLWMREDMAALGWHDPPVNIAAFVQPFETWADMHHLIAEERFTLPPRALAYFCSVMGDPAEAPDPSDRGYLHRQRELVRRNAIRFLNEQIGHLWPNSVAPRGGFRWELLADPEETAPAAAGAADAKRFKSQYWTANANPSERYVLSLPGTARYRISPLDNTYDNLTIAGDWTDCGFNEGCVEAAVMSGRLAAHAISSSPALEEIVGYDHP
ncbi:MAG TPA: NAD(P)-binding protein [Candidatus Binataceae bacterium]|nr:NAD(P)-binding protein [Candidatus Binataceae bacterium]